MPGYSPQVRTRATPQGLQERSHDIANVNIFLTVTTVETYELLQVCYAVAQGFHVHAVFNFRTLDTSYILCLWVGDIFSRVHNIFQTGLDRLSSRLLRELTHLPHILSPRVLTEQCVYSLLSGPLCLSGSVCRCRAGWPLSHTRPCPCRAGRSPFLSA